ncbi:hypothetical protein L2E82_01146 [Cichorium intybus]|uniref:Uncharacterized protein n=1 Tax=Cichorium intybus TaxID=13427 RepID=A0ACB9H082_CICIN|nr:hypothetical protein L2E82_01146 [Cichorium intybus]
MRLLDQEEQWKEDTLIPFTSSSSIGWPSNLPATKRRYVDCISSSGVDQAERKGKGLDFGLFCEHFYLVIYAPLTLGFHSSHSTISSQLRVSVPRSLKSTTGIFRTLESN